MSRRALLPSISDLLAFEAAARHSSFTRAAAELNLTQSAISRNIRMLEEAMGVPLFQRVQQRVVLTAAGALYMQDTQRILDDLRQATQRAMAFAEQSTVLNIAVLPTFASRYLMPRLAVFAGDRPNLTLNFATRLKPFDFASEPFDAAIHYGKPVWPNAVAHHLMDEWMVAVASRDYLERHRPQRPEDLTRSTLLHLSTRPMAWAEWFQAAGVEGVTGLKGPCYDQFSMLADAAAAGIGVALLPSILVEDDIASGRLSVVLGAPFKSANAYYWVVPEDRRASGALLELSAWILDHVAATPGSAAA